MPLDPTVSVALTTVTVRVNGREMPQTYGLLSLEIGREVGRIPYAHLVLQDGDPAAQTFAISESESFVPGAEIEIDLGYDRSEQRAFKGVVTRQRIEAGPRGASRLHVEVKHPCFRMAHARKSRVWTDTTDADALSDLAAAHGIAIDADAAEATRAQLVQHQATDWDFALVRAEMTARLLLAEDDGLRLFRPDPAQSPASRLTYGVDVFTLDLELNAEAQPEAVQAGAWDPADQGVASAESVGNDVPGPGDLDGASLAEVAGSEPKPRHPGPRDQAELDSWSLAVALRRRLSAVSGSVEMQGSTGFRPGDTTELSGFGRRFDGTAFVSGVRHVVARGDWRSILQIGLEPRFHAERKSVAAPPAGGLTPGIVGLQIGVVDALEADPAGEARIAVRIATETEAATALWARPLSIGGGADRGLVMLPDIGDECLLGFLDGDPRDPIVLGGLHSSAAASPLPGTDENQRKGMVSRTGMRILFDDETSALTLETPNGNRLRLSDEAGGTTLEDGSGNSVTTAAGGVTIESANDVTIRAQGDVEIEGVNLTLRAQASAKFEGRASANLESGGQTVVKGATVMIN